MPTKLPRATINIPEKLFQLLQRDCRRERKELSALIIERVLEAYPGQFSQPMFFGRSRQWQEGSRRAAPPVFEAPAQPALEQNEDRRESLGQGKN